MQFPQAWDSTHSSQLSWHEACRNAPVPPSQDPPGFPPGSLKTGTAKALDCTGCTDGWVLNTSPALCPLPAKLEGPRHLVVNNWAPSSLFTYLWQQNPPGFRPDKHNSSVWEASPEGNAFLIATLLLQHLGGTRGHLGTRDKEKVNLPSVNPLESVKTNAIL